MKEEKRKEFVRVSDDDSDEQRLTFNYLFKQDENERERRKDQFCGFLFDVRDDDEF